MIYVGFLQLFFLMILLSIALHRFMVLNRPIYEFLNCLSSNLKAFLLKAAMEFCQCYHLHRSADEDAQTLLFTAFRVQLFEEVDQEF